VVSSGIDMRAQPQIDVALLTGGGDRPYAYGLATALMSQGVGLDVVAGDELDGPEFRNSPRVRFLNLRRDQRPDASVPAKVSRVLLYYGRLFRYALHARPRIFHILWNNKFEVFDRTALMLYYKLLGKQITMTVHNVNAGIRDATDTLLNRVSLKIQYRFADHIFVHTNRMKDELARDFGVCPTRITVIPFGINNAVPQTAMTSAEARLRLGVGARDKTILFFGNIAPYKGLEYLLDAFRRIKDRDCYRLIVAGKPRKGSESYWAALEGSIASELHDRRILTRIEFVPDEETEIYFKAADLVVLPYTEIFQSGVLFLGYSFGLPVIASDVGSLKDDIVEGRTGYVVAKTDPADLARAIEAYFGSSLYAGLAERRKDIRAYATERHSWVTVGEMTQRVYQALFEKTL
jgi:glycosyltransferase involved in cell wall biosynthesis